MSQVKAWLIYLEREDIMNIYKVNKSKEIAFLKRGLLTFLNYFSKSTLSLSSTIFLPMAFSNSAFAELYSYNAV